MVIFIHFIKKKRTKQIIGNAKKQTAIQRMVYRA